MSIEQGWMVIGLLAFLAATTQERGAAKGVFYGLAIWSMLSALVLSVLEIVIKVTS